MKAEPLKNKDFRTDCEDGLHCFVYKDVQSAVEWMKDKLQFFPKTMENDFKIIELLDEAFEDVVKKN